MGIGMAIVLFGIVVTLASSFIVFFRRKSNGMNARNTRAMNREDLLEINREERGRRVKRQESSHKIHAFDEIYRPIDHEEAQLPPEFMAKLI